mgnify:FL=1
MLSEPNINKLNITEKYFGTLSSGQHAQIFTLTNAHGIKIKITNYCVL